MSLELPTDEFAVPQVSIQVHTVFQRPNPSQLHLHTGTFTILDDFHENWMGLIWNHLDMDVEFQQTLSLHHGETSSSWDFLGLKMVVP